MATRRGVGLGAFQNRSATSQSFASHGANLRNSHAQALKTQLSVFQGLLHAFALEHASKIKSNPTFRAEFARMCNAIGVDPLAGSNVRGKKAVQGESWWAQMLGGDVNDFYFEIAVRIVEICRKTRDENGGLIAVDECKEMVSKGKSIGSEVDVSDDDILRAVDSLKPLESGFAVIKVGSKTFIRSIPKELNVDQSTALEIIQITGYLTVSMLRANLEWEKERAEMVISQLLTESLVWVDEKAPNEREFWSPTLNMTEQ